MKTNINIFQKIKEFFLGQEDYTLETYEDIDNKILNKTKNKILRLVIIFPIVAIAIIILVKASITYYDYNYGNKKNMDIKSEQEQQKKQKNTDIKVNDIRLWKIRTETEQEKLKENIVEVKSSIVKMDKKLDSSVEKIGEDIKKQSADTQKKHTELIDIINKQSKRTKEMIDDIGKNYEEKLQVVKKELKDKVKESGELTKLDPTKLLPLSKSQIKQTKQKKEHVQVSKPIKQVEYLSISEENDVEDFEISTLEKYEEAEKKQPTSFTLDAGFAKATILAAGEFNTMKVAEKDTIPVFLQIDTKLITANDGEADLIGCNLRGTGKGDFSTSKVPVTIVKIDCTLEDEDGVHYRISEDINGVIYDETGGYAMKGRLITKEGEVFAKAIPIALLETGLNILTEKANNEGKVDTGDTINFTGATSKGVASTTQTIVNKMGDYWLAYLDALNPKVDVRPGRQVVVAFYGGEKLKIKKYIPADLENFEKGLIDASYVDDSEEDNTTKIKD